MQRQVLLIFIFLGCFFVSPAQKIKIISVFQVIESGKYDEAKKTIEEAIIGKKTLDWPKTWYAKGFLCQTAYEKGIKDNDKKKFELYPEQLYLAYESYEKAISLDKRGKLGSQITPMYMHLANDFQKLGEKNYDGRKYEDALKAFELAIKIMESPLISVRKDTNLLYNTALAAYACKDWDKSINFLSGLHKDNYSLNASHLLFTVYLTKGDTTSAERTLLEGIKSYEDNENLVLLLVDMLFRKNDTKRAEVILDSASVVSPSKYIFPYTKGLVYQKTEQFSKAIDAYKEALKLAPEEMKIFANIGTCHYNSGVEIEEKARTITNNKSFLEEKAKSVEAFESALDWFEKANKINPVDLEVNMKLQQLYKVLGKTENTKGLKGQVD